MNYDRNVKDPPDMANDYENLPSFWNADHNSEIEKKIIFFKKNKMGEDQNKTLNAGFYEKRKETRSESEP